MKTIKFVLLLAFLASPVFIFSQYRSLATTGLQTTLEPAADASGMVLRLRKPDDRPLTLRLNDAQGRLVATHVVAEASTQAQVYFPLQTLPDGEYRLEALDGRLVRVQEVVLETGKSVRRITVRTIL